STTRLSLGLALRHQSRGDSIPPGESRRANNLPVRQDLIGLVCLDSRRALGQSKRHCQRSSPKPTSTASASQQQTTSPSRRPVNSTSALNGSASISLGPLTRTGPHT